MEDKTVGTWETMVMAAPSMGFLKGSVVKNLPAMRVPQVRPWELPWRREWLPTPVFLPGEFHGQRSLAGYSPWGLKELDMTEQLTLTLSISRECFKFISFPEKSKIVSEL